MMQRRLLCSPALALSRRIGAWSFSCATTTSSSNRRRLSSSSLSSPDTTPETATTTPTTRLLEQLENLDTTVLCDADKTLRNNNTDYQQGIALLHRLQSIPTRQRSVMVGQARTVQLTSRNDFLGVLQGLVQAQEGEVLVVSTMTSNGDGDDDEEERAIAGDLFATEAVRKGLRGIVIDGCVRDRAQLAQLDGIRCYAKARTTPYSGKIQHAAKVQVEIDCGGARIRPGDVLVGDDDGLVVGTTNVFQRLVPVAQEIQRLEEQIRNGIQQGKSLESMTNYRQHIQRRSEGKPSDLEFCP